MPAATGSAGATLREQIHRSGGTIPFEEYMRFALYDLRHGYYARRVRTVGRAGDFSTSATLHSALADAVAAWASSHRTDGTAADGRWHLIELGGGSGELAARILDRLGWWDRRRLRYGLVEVSAGLRTAQQTCLARWAGKVSWHDSLSDALVKAEGVALVFSNEFVDAFPCARWVLDEPVGWREVRVAWADGEEQPEEIIGGRVAEAEQAFASVAAVESTAKHSRGQQVEIFGSYRRWQREQLTRWQRGRLLTIDYGDELPGLYHRRPAGTLRAYCRHMRFTGREIYARIGQQDLTADVNFSDLQRWGDQLGLATSWYGTQADFLRRWLPPSALRQAGRDSPIAYLLDPQGPGGMFKALEQTRGCRALV